MPEVARAPLRLFLLLLRGPQVRAVRDPKKGIGLNVYAAFRLSTCVQTILNPPAKSNVVDLAAHR